MLYELCLDRAIASCYIFTEMSTQGTKQADSLQELFLLPSDERCGGREVALSGAG